MKTLTVCSVLVVSLCLFRFGTSQEPAAPAPVVAGSPAQTSAPVPAQSPAPVQGLSSAPVPPQSPLPGPAMTSPAPDRPAVIGLTSDQADQPDRPIATAPINPRGAPHGLTTAQSPLNSRRSNFPVAPTSNVPSALTIPRAQNPLADVPHPRDSLFATSNFDVYVSETPVTKAMSQLANAETDEEKSNAKKELKTRLEEEYEQFLDTDRQQLEKMRERLDRLESQLEKRNDAKDRLVELKMEMLVSESEGIVWPGQEGSSWRGSPGFAPGSSFAPRTRRLNRNRTNVVPDADGNFRDLIEDNDDAGQNRFPTRPDVAPVPDVYNLPGVAPTQPGQPGPRFPGQTSVHSETPRFIDALGPEPGTRTRTPVDTHFNVNPLVLPLLPPAVPPFNRVIDPLAENAFDDLLSRYASLLENGDFKDFIEKALNPVATQQAFLSRNEKNIGRYVRDIANSASGYLTEIEYALNHEAILQNKRASWIGCALTLEQNEEGLWYIGSEHSVGINFADETTTIADEPEDSLPKELPLPGRSDNSVDDPGRQE